MLGACRRRTLVAARAAVQPTAASVDDDRAPPVSRVFVLNRRVLAARAERTNSRHIHLKEAFRGYDGAFCWG